MFTKVALLGALMLTSLAATSANAIKAYQTISGKRTEWLREASISLSRRTFVLPSLMAMGK